MHHNLYCMVKEPTRITETSATLLDQVLTNAPNFVSNIEIFPPISTNDHCTVSCELSFKLDKEQPYTRTVWQYSEADFDLFRQELQAVDFDECFATNDVDYAADCWTDKILTTAKSVIPNKIALIRPNDSPWYTNALRKFKRKVQRLFKRHKKTPSVNNWESYRTARNEYQKKLNCAELEYKTSLSESLGRSRNTKSWWKTVKTLLGKGCADSYPTLNVNNVPISKSRDKANAFNSFFHHILLLMTLQHHCPMTMNFLLVCFPYKQVSRKWQTL